MIISSRMQGMSWLKSEPVQLSQSVGLHILRHLAGLRARAGDKGPLVDSSAAESAAC